METYGEWVARAATLDSSKIKADAEAELRDLEALLKEHPELTLHTFSLRAVVLNCRNSGIDLICYSHMSAYAHVYGNKTKAIGCDRCQREFELMKPSDLRK